MVIVFGSVVVSSRPDQLNVATLSSSESRHSPGSVNEGSDSAAGVTASTSSVSQHSDSATASTTSVSQHTGSATAVTASTSSVSHHSDSATSSEQHDSSDDFDGYGQLLTYLII